MEVGRLKRRNVTRVISGGVDMQTSLRYDEPSYSLKSLKRALPGNLHYAALPEQKPLHRALRKWLGNVKPRGDPVDGWGDLTEEEMRRVRFRWENRGPYSSLGHRWKGLNLLYTLLEKKTKRAMLSVLRPRICTRFMSGSVDVFIAWLKELGTIAKRWGPMWRPDWALFVNLETLGGYQQKAEEQLVDQVVDWVGKGKVFGAHIAWDRYVREFFKRRDNVISQDAFPPVREFFRDWANWANSGSSDGPRPDASWTEDGQHVRKQVRKNKWASAAALSTDELLQLRREGPVTEYKALAKRETGKVRAVISAGLKSYLRQVYIADVLERGYTSIYSPLLESASSKFSDTYIEDWPSCIRFPLDQSAFDNHKSRAAMLAVARGMQRMMEEDGWPEYIVREWQPFLEDLEAKADVNAFGEKIEWKKGLLSGWRFTSLMGTVLNFCETRWALDVTEAVYPGLRWRAKFMGDDVQLCVNIVEAGLMVMDLLNAAGDEINATKQFISESRDEFLRRVLTRKDNRGYPARAVNVILWRNPIKKEPVRGLERLEEVIEGWSVLFGRILGWVGMDAAAGVNLMMKDLRGASKFGSTEIRRLMGTPRSVGGLGVYVGWGKWSAYSKGKKEYKYELEGAMAGVAEMEETWVGLGVEEGTVRSVANEYLKKVLEPPVGVPTHVEPGELEYPKSSRLTWVAVSMDDTFRIASPQWREDVPQTWRAEVVTLTDFEVVRSWLTDESRLVFDDLRSRWRKSLVYEWLNGRLGPTSPRMLGIATDYIAQIAKKHWPSALRWLYHRKATILDLRSAQADVEMKTRVVVERRWFSHTRWWT
jgi:hypothetical protein